MACQKGKALGLLTQQSCAQVTVADTNLTVVGNRTGNTEGLQAEADLFCCVSCVCYAVLDGDCRADNVCPTCVFKADRLNALYHVIYINALFVTNLFCLFNRGDAVLFQLSIDLVDSSLITLK